MKVNKENNSRMVTLCVIGIILGLIFSFTSVNNAYLFYYYISYIAIRGIYIALLMYFISVLQFSNESVSVQNPFSIFLGLEVVRLIGEVFFAKSVGNLLSGIGMVELIILIYIMIGTLKIKSEKLKWPFRTLGILLLLTSIVRMGFLFGSTGQINDLLKICINLTSVLPLLATYYILSTTKNILKNIELTDINQ